MPLLQEMVAEGSLYGGLMHSLNFQAVAPLQREFGLPWPVFRSLAALEAYGSELTRRDAAAATFRDLPDHFPPPPVLPATGCSGIRPITSPKQLYQHAEKEHNCAFSFSEAISQGQYYIYAVDHPVRATLSFVRGENSWVLCDVLGPANTALPEWTREYVLSAFDELPAALQGADAELSAVCLEDGRTPFD